MNNMQQFILSPVLSILMSQLLFHYNLAGYIFSFFLYILSITEFSECVPLFVIYNPKTD